MKDCLPVVTLFESKRSIFLERVTELRAGVAAGGLEVTLWVEVFFF